MSVSFSGLGWAGLDWTGSSLVWLTTKHEPRLRDGIKLAQLQKQRRKGRCVSVRNLRMNNNHGGIV